MDADLWFCSEARDFLEKHGSGEKDVLSKFQNLSPETQIKVAFGIAHARGFDQAAIFLCGALLRCPNMQEICKQMRSALKRNFDLEKELFNTRQHGRGRKPTVPEVFKPQERDNSSTLFSLQQLALLELSQKK